MESTNEITAARFAECVRAGDLDEVRAMLAVRPELANMPLSYGNERRPIHFAVMGRQPEMTRLLMEHGADANAGVYPHRDATSAMTLAEDRGYEEIVAILREFERPEETGESVEVEAERDPAQEAVAAGDVKWLRQKHAEGTLVNAIDSHAGGLLTAAVRHRRPEVLRALLELGFDPDERSAWRAGDEMAQSAGCPLWECGATGDLEMAELLLRHGANPNAEVDSSGTAVYSAYSHKQWEMAELLRRRGGVTGADTTAIYRLTAQAREMLERDATVAGDLLRFGASGGDPEIVRMALAKIDWARDDARWFGTLIEPLYFWHHIPWLYAGNRDFDRSTYLPCFRLILERCDAGARGNFGQTALHEVGAMRAHIKREEAQPFAEALLDAGASATARDAMLLSTPLGWACRWGRIEVAHTLLARGADAVEADAEPWARPRAWAAKRGHAEILALLSEHGG